MLPAEAPGGGSSCLFRILGLQEPSACGFFAWSLPLSSPGFPLLWVSSLSLIRTLSQDLGPPWSSLRTLNLYVQRSCFQMRSLSQVSWVRTRTFHFGGSSPTISSYSKAPSCTEIVEVVEETVPSYFPGKQAWSVGMGRRGWKMCLQVWAQRLPSRSRCRVSKQGRS